MTLILHEDDDILAVNKPAGWNTHAPDPFAPAGLYEWLRSREPRWATLATMHRLDKDTSGVLLFAKTPRARQSLSQQFAGRAVAKTYAFLTDRPVPAGELVRRSWLVRKGEKYREERFGGRSGGGSAGQLAITRFQRAEAPGGGSGTGQPTLVRARPETGRTHQIRVQAAGCGFPVLGDTLYGGSPAARLHLHASEIRFLHPATRQQAVLSAPADFESDPAATLRLAIVDQRMTDAFRLINGAADGWPDWSVDKLGAYLLSQAGGPLTPEKTKVLAELTAAQGCFGAYHKALAAAVRAVAPEDASPRPAVGQAAAPEFVIRENGIAYTLSFEEGYSTGLFLDQRDNRRRFLVNYIAPGFVPFPNGPAGAEVLNVFAYTCGFSLCSAWAGARSTSLDLSRKYLEWGKRNFELNGLDPGDHDFICGDAFEWMRRLARKGRRYDVVILDPPTFSTSKRSGVFRAEKDYGYLVAAAVPLVKRDGVLFASTNAARLRPDRFVAGLEKVIEEAGRRVDERFFASQPPDFRPSREEPAYLKTVWLRLA